MSRILVYTSPARGHLFPIMALVLELRARGHDVAVRTHAVDVELVRAQGVRAAAVDPRVEAVAGDDWQARNPREGLKASVRTFTSRAPYDGPDLRAAIELEHPDAVVVDVNAWGAMTEAEAWGGPWAAFFPYPMPLDSVDTPPFGPALPPARTILGRGRDRLLRPVLVGTLEKLMRPGMNQLRTARGLAPLASVNDLFGAPPLTLYTTAEPFEYHRRDLPANVVMVGPLEWEPPVHPPAWLDEVDGPLVLVTTSTEYQEDTRLVRTALEALADEPVHVVATLPSDDRRRRARRRRVPPRGRRRRGRRCSGDPAAAGRADPPGEAGRRGGAGRPRGALTLGETGREPPVGRDATADHPVPHRVLRRWTVQSSPRASPVVHPKPSQRDLGAGGSRGWVHRWRSRPRAGVEPAG